MSEKMAVETRTLEQVRDSEWKSWISVASIEAGVMICVPSLLLGGMLAEAMPMSMALIAGVTGYLLAVLLTAAMGVQGYDLGIPLCVISLSSFGKKGGKWIVTTLLVISLMGWFAVQASVCGEAFSSMLSEFLHVNVPGWISISVWGMIMLITAVYGIDALKGLNFIAVPALIAVTMLGCVIAVARYGLGGLGIPVESTMTVWEGIALTFSFNATGMVIAPDYTRYNKSRKDAAKAMIWGIFPAGVLMLVMGAVMSKLTGIYDITVVLCELGIPFLGLVVLILATWTSNTTNAYSAGISMVMLFHLKDSKRAVTTLIAGVVGTILALAGIADYFENVLDLMGYAFAPMGGVMIAEYWVLMKGKAVNWKKIEGINWLGLASWIAGILVTVLVPVGIPVINGLLTSAVCLLILNICFRGIYEECI